MTLVYNIYLNFSNTFELFFKLNQYNYKYPFI